MNQGSILVASKTSAGVAPRRSARSTVCRRPSCGTRASSSASCAVPAGSGWVQNPPGVCSSERMAFCSASTNDRPIAIASPTDFIVVVSSASAPGNFSKANRGIFTTT